MVTSDETTTKEIIKKYGDVVKSGSEIFEERSKLQIIPVSPALDIALGGGLMEGRVWVMAWRWCMINMSVCSSVVASMWILLFLR